MLTEYALQLRNHFAVKTAAEIATFLLKMEQGHLMISDIPVGDWGTIFVQSSQAGTISVSQAALVRLTLLEVLNQKLSEA